MHRRIDAHVHSIFYFVLADYVARIYRANYPAANILFLRREARFPHVTAFNNQAGDTLEFLKDPISP